MKYELWANKDRTNLSFFGVEYSNYEQNLQLLKEEGDEFEVIWTTEAETYNEAMQKYYDFMDWGKYKPIDE
jgi:phage terminase small subunit